MTRPQQRHTLMSRSTRVRRSLVGPADWVRIRQSYPSLDPSLVSELIGWERRRDADNQLDEAASVGQDGDNNVEFGIVSPGTSDTRVPPASESSQERPKQWPELALPTRIWMPVAHAAESSLLVTQPVAVEGKLNWREAPKSVPMAKPLNSWAVLGPRLRAVFADLLQSGELDIDRTVERLADAQGTESLVFRPRKRWGSNVQVLVDRSRHLMPYFRDQDSVVRALRRLLGHGPLDVFYGFGCETSSYGRLGPLHNPWLPYEPAQAGTRVLVLGDLGCLDQAASETDGWAAFGVSMRQRGCQPLALVPCDLGRLDQKLLTVFRVRGWGKRETGTSFASQRAQRVREILRLIAYCVRVEPGLLRDCRQLVAGAIDPGLESDVWQESLFINRTSDAAEPGASEDTEDLIREFEALPAKLREQSVRAVRRWRPHARIGCEIFFEELSRLSTATRGLLDKADWEDAIAGWTYLVNYVTSRPQSFSDPIADYVGRLDFRLSPTTLLNPDVGKLSGDLQRHLAAGEGVAARGLAADRITIALVGNDLWARGESDSLPCEALPPRAKRIVSLRTRSGVLQVLPGAPLAANVDTDPTSTLPPRQLAAGETWRFSPPACDAVTLKTDAESVRLEMRPRPVWASKWGVDSYGVWADLIVREAVIRWRWIAPGSFLMGSPDTEPGRDDDEGPRHWVTITRGFWMMATPCTQQQWTELIPKNPSRFVHPDRPVEGMTLMEVNRFIGMLTKEENKRFSGETRNEGSFRLPTEAEWEYACRADSEDALYRVTGSLGQIEIRGENNAPSLDAIAWYGGNSGHGFELAEGEDSSRWPQKQRLHTVAGSRKVGEKLPNSWGLYDMLGNVWESCSDSKRDYTDEAVTNPGLDSVAVGSRCVRGGSWGDFARMGRSAFRGVSSSMRKGAPIGFRLVRFQDGS